VFYSAFGLSLAANRPLPGLVPRPAVPRVDTRIWLHADPPADPLDIAAASCWYVSDPAGETPALRVWRLNGGASFRLRYADGTEFVIDRAGSDIRATWPASSTLEDTATYLLGPVLGFALRLRGVACLHASVVAAGDHALAFVGPAEAGKSTLAAAFAHRGFPILSDDIAALADSDATLRVQPAYPQLRLWPDTVARLYGTEDALPRLTPSWDKRALDLTRNGYRFEQRPLPLGAVYALAGRADDQHPRVEPLHGREALRTLLAHTYVGYLLDSAMRAQEFTTLGRLASTIPVRRLVQPAGADLQRLPAAILDDWEALGCTASPTTAR